MTHFLQFCAWFSKWFEVAEAKKLRFQWCIILMLFPQDVLGNTDNQDFREMPPPLSKMQGANWNWRATRSCVRQFVHAILSHTPKFNVSKLGALCAWHCGCRDREEGVVMGQAGDPVAQGWLSRPSLPNHQHFASHVVPHVTSLFGHDCNLGKIQDTWFMCTQFF